MNYNSIYKPFSNRTLNWLAGDSNYVYKRNLEKNYEELVKYEWVDKSFTYTFNSLGFRCSEFADKPTIMFLGCSYTLGVGVPHENCYTTIVSEALGMACANLGQSAGSLDTCFRLCHGYIGKINPKVVILMSPPGIRKEIVTERDIVNILANDIPLHYFYKEWTIDENNSYFNKEKNILSIEYLCQQRNIKFINVDYQILNNHNSLARDLQHPGIQSHLTGANYILDLF